MILVGDDSRVLVQGITGREGRFHTEQMLNYGTNIVAGVTPGRGGEWVLGIPVFDTVRESVETTGANTTIIYVPAASAADAILEAIAAEVRLVVCITEGIPVLDMARVHQILRHTDVRLIGPNSPGVITPGQAKVGIMPADILRPGPVGIVARSGALSYEIVQSLSDEGMGQSTVVGIGGDPIIGSNFTDILRLFEADPLTEHVVMIGEIGGTDEQDAATFIATHMSTPVTAFIAGRSAPRYRRMGHAGAIIHDPEEAASAKIAALEAAGVKMALSPEHITDLVRESLQQSIVYP